MVFKLTISERLKKARKSRGITQDELAKMIGSSRGVITNIELGKITKPQPLILNALCTALEINSDWLLHGTGDMDNIDSIKSAKILSEIYSISKELSEDEQLYVLDLIKTYQKHLNKKESD